jgi:tetratricopeptide (TPR) repeat protein
MWFKKLFIALSILVSLLIIFFIGFSDSYKYSFEAKVKYTLGDYDEAMKLASKAFELDPYNKMAFSILAQSKISIKFLDYINDAKEYLKKIDRLSKKKTLSQQDKIKIKMMCEVMLGRFKKLSPTIMTDKSLYKKSKELNKEFVKIYENLD